MPKLNLELTQPERDMLDLLAERTLSFYQDKPSVTVMLRRIGSGELTITYPHLCKPQTPPPSPQAPIALSALIATPCPLRNFG